MDLISVREIYKNREQYSSWYSGNRSQRFSQVVDNIQETSRDEYKTEPA